METETAGFEAELQEFSNMKPIYSGQNISQVNEQNTCYCEKTAIERGSDFLWNSTVITVYDQASSSPSLEINKSSSVQDLQREITNTNVDKFDIFNLQIFGSERVYAR